MPSLDRPLQEAEFVDLFQDLASELDSRSLTATIVLAGGAYMMFLRLRDATADADSITRLSRRVKEAAAAVGDRHGLKPTWLNDNAMAFAPPGAATEPRYTFFEAESLRIEGPHPDAVFLMKIGASRAASSDRSDAIALWNHCTFESPQAAVDRYYDAYPHEELDPYLVDLVAEIADIAERATG